jgi:uroporphyrinogen-III synthase
VTRPEPGVLAELLIAADAHVVHMPLIEMIDPEDSGAALRSALADLQPEDWLVVTSPEGARRVVVAADSIWLSGAYPPFKVAAVGRATAAVVQVATRRPVDLIPAVQLGSAVVSEMAQLPQLQRVLVAHGDLADPSLVAGLGSHGHQVTAVVAYRTVARAPSVEALQEAREADAVVLASGSAARSWAQYCAQIHPPVVCVIGPSTAAVARECGLNVTHHAEESSVEGILACLNQAFDPGHPTMG